MKIFSCLIFLSICSIQINKAQNTQKVGDTIEVVLDGYKEGKIQWQFSTDKQKWNDIKGDTNEKLTYIIVEAGYFRAKINTCNFEYLSDATFEIKIYPNIKTILESIKICRWKGDVNTCLNMSFDDGCISQKQISEIFDQYGFKASFFIIPTVLNKWYTLKTDDVKDISKRGHEIGNHTYSHTLQFQSEKDISKIDFEIKNGKEMIEDILKIKCVSFADPWHQNSPLSRSIVFKYHLSSRDYSEYLTYNRLSIDSTLRINTVTSYLNKGIKNRDMLIMSGHGIENDGYSPIKKAFLVQMLDSVKKYVDTGQLWLTTLKEGEQYDNLFHEIKLSQEIHDDTLVVKFGNYYFDKYKDLEESPISISIENSLANRLSILSENVEIKKMENRLVYTTNLKRSLSLYFHIIE